MGNQGLNLTQRLNWWLCWRRIIMRRRRPDLSRRMLKVGPRRLYWSGRTSGHLEQQRLNMSNQDLNLRRRLELRRPLRNFGKWLNLRYRLLNVSCRWLYYGKQRLNLTPLIKWVSNFTPYQTTQPGVVKEISLKNINYMAISLYTFLKWYNFKSFHIQKTNSLPLFI